MQKARSGKRYLHIDAAHKKYGKYVRISPRQLSIADHDAYQVLYGHSTGHMKTVFCEYHLMYLLVEFGRAIHIPIQHILCTQMMPLLA